MRLLRLFKRDLHKEARGRVEDGIISESQAEGICNRYGIDYHDQTPHTFSEINMPEAVKAGGLRWNEVVYVKLKPGKRNVHVFDSASLTKPDTGLYIRGRLQSPYVDEQPYRIRYGIEALFAPEKKALALEDRLRDGGIAVVMLADNGKAALKGVVGDINE